MSSFPSSSIGLPNTCNYTLPPSLSDNSKSTNISQAPDGITVVSGPSTGFQFAANQSISNPFTSQVVSFTIPSGNSSTNSIFLDPSATCLSFTVTYTISNTPSVTGGRVKLLGSAASFWDQLVLYSDNVPLEQCGNYGLLQNFLLQNTCNLSERYGGVSVSMGADTNTANGIDLAFAAAGTYRYNFCIPLISIIGVNSDKLIPISSINNLQLQMTTATVLPIAVYCTGVTTQPTFSTPITITDLNLNLKYIDLGDMAGALLSQTLQDGKWFIKTSTYTNSTVALPTGSGGSQQLMLQLRQTSVKSIYSQFGQSNSIAAQSLCTPSGYYDAINIGTNFRQLQIGQSFYPSKGINDLQQSAYGYNFTIQSMGGGPAKSLGTVVNRLFYNTLGGLGPASGTPALIPIGSDTYCNYAISTTPLNRSTPAGSDDSSANDILNWPAMAYYGYDLEKSNSSNLFQGVNTRATPPFLNLTLSTTLASSITCNAWAYSDLILQIDTVSKQARAFV